MDDIVSKELKSDVIFTILKILYEDSDKMHRLTQKQIVEKLNMQYEIYPDRKTIRRNIFEIEEHIKAFGYDVKYKTTERYTTNEKTGKKVDSSIYNEFYMEHLFEKGELSLLIDGLLFSKQIDLEKRKALIKKLEGLSNKHFKSRVKHINVIQNESSKNNTIFQDIEKIDNAIEESKQITFYYNRYFINKKMKAEFLPQPGRDGEAKIYTVNPYQILAANGRYYLMCNNDPYDNLSYYRLDRISNIDISKQRRRPLKEIKGVGKSFELAKHMVEQVYMYSGESERVTLSLKKVIINDFIDWFGSDHQFFNETEDEVCVRVMVNENAMKKWALQYGLYVRVLAPTHLVEEVKNDIKIVMENYNL